jgi:hypothetical protein
MYQEIADDLHGVEQPPPEEETGGSGEGGDQPPEEPPSPRLVQVGNLSVPEDEVVSLLEFQNWARANPDKMEAFGQYLRGEAEFRVPEKPKQPEIDWTVVDPNIKSAYEQQAARLEELQSKIDAFEEPITQIQEQQASQFRNEVQVALDAATGKIQERFKLNDDELDQLAEDAAKLNIVPSLRSQGMEPQAALETALETAFWSGERWRTRVVDEEIAARNGNDRKSRASQITGVSGGNGEGLSSRPQNEGDRRAAMTAEIAEALRGTP